MKFKKLIYSLLVVSLGTLTIGCTTTKEPAKKEEKPVSITISAASSLKNVLTDAKTEFEKQNKNVKININFGASGALRKQIEEGAPVDIFVSADSSNVAALKDKKLVDEDSVKTITSNKIVLIGSKDSNIKIKDLSELPNLTFKNIAIATPETAPAGFYSKESLNYYKVFDKIKSKIVYGKDVQTALSYVESGNAELGMVFYSDAKSSKNSKVLLEVPSNTHSKISYDCGIISTSKEKDTCKKIISFFTSDKGQSILEKYGFSPIK